MLDDAIGLIIYESLLAAEMSYFLLSDSGISPNNKGEARLVFFNISLEYLGPVHLSRTLSEVNLVIYKGRNRILLRPKAGN